MTFKIILDIKKKLFLSFVTFAISLLIICNNVIIYAYISNDNGFSNVQSSFYPDNYEIDYNKKHEVKEWKHEGGSVFSLNSRLFLDIPEIKMIPCKSYQEWGSIRQLGKDTVLIGLGFIPALGHAVNWGYNIAEITGITDKWVDQSEDKIAMLTDIVYYYLEKDPGKGFFFFDANELENIKQIDVAFCDCDKHIFIINEITESLMQKRDFDTTHIDYTKDIQLAQKIFLEQKAKKLVLKKINQKVGHKIAQTALKKAAKKTVGRFLGKIFTPSLITAYDKAEQIKESENNLKNRITFDTINNTYEKTIGFALHFASENEIEIYELKEKYNYEKTFRLVSKTNINDSDHILINILKTKTIDGINKSVPLLNIYGGSLKRGLN